MYRSIYRKYKILYTTYGELWCTVCYSVWLIHFLSCFLEEMQAFGLATTKHYFLIKVSVISDKDTLKLQTDTEHSCIYSLGSSKELVPSLNVCTTNPHWIQLMSSTQNEHNNQSMAPHLRSLLSASLNRPLRENIQLMRHLFPSHQLLCVFSCKNCFMLSVYKCSSNMSWESVYVWRLIWFVFRKHFLMLSIKSHFFFGWCQSKLLWLAGP